MKSLIKKENILGDGLRNLRGLRGRRSMILMKEERGPRRRRMDILRGLLIIRRVERGVWRGIRRDLGGRLRRGVVLLFLCLVLGSGPLGWDGN